MSTIRFPACPVCDGSSSLWRQVDGHRIERCGACGFAYVNPRPGRAELTEMYRELGGHCRGAATAAEVVAAEHRAPNSTVDARRIVGALGAMVGSRGRLLDVGCGFGFFSREAVEAGFDVTALEIAPAERRVATELLGFEPLAIEFEEFDDEREEFAAVLMSQVLEHAADPAEWVARASRLLAPGGVLAIAVPSFGSLLRRLAGRRDPYVTPPVHLNYFSPGNLGLLLERAGLEVVRADTVSRVRHDALSRRLGGPVLLQRACELLVAHGQRPLFAATDRTGLGLFANVFGRRRAHGSVSAQR